MFMESLFLTYKLRPVQFVCLVPGKSKNGQIYRISTDLPKSVFISQEMPNNNKYI